MRRSLELILAAATIFSSFAATATLANDDADSPPPYQVRVNGVSVTVNRAHTWEPGYVPPYGGSYWFCSFDISEPVEVEVTTTKSLDKLVVLPESRGVVAKITGTNAVMQFFRPGQFVFEPDGKNGPLMIFANPPEAAPPDRNDPNVKYFGPGEHDAGAIELTDNQTLYLAAGAIVRGGVRAKGSNITIRGRGILDGNSYPRFKGPTRYPILLEDCHNVTVEGIVIKDGWSWTFVPRGCDGVRVENIKLLCARVENGDGFDPVNSLNVTLVNSFIRSDDDCISPKGMGADWQSFCRAEGAGEGLGAPMENLVVENCILWTDRAHVWRLGAECVAPVMRNFTFRNIDVLHFPDLWTPDEVPFCISLEPSDELPMENILFEDIRIRTAGQKGFIDVRPKVTQWARKPVPGRIQNIIFRNMSFSGPAGAVPGRIRVSGPGPRYCVSNVLFENVTRNGEPLTAKGPGVELLGSVHGISFARSTTQVGDTNASPLASWKGVTINPAPKHPPVVLAEARKPRGVIAAQGGAGSSQQAAVARLQAGLQRAIGTTLPVVDASTKPWLAVIIGDSPQAQAAGLTSDKIDSGGFEIRTMRECVLIVGKGDGLIRGVDAFLAHSLRFLPEGATEMGTDLVVAPVSLSGRSEKTPQ